MLSAYGMDICTPARPPSPVLNTEQIVKEVWSGKTWYTSMRKDYQRAVCVLWEDNSITVEPVSNLIDFVTHEVCAKIIPVLYNWKVSVEYNMCKSKLCAFCINNRKEDNFICSECEENTWWLESFINKEQTIRENKYITDIYFNKNVISPEPSTIHFPIKLPYKRKQCEMQQNMKMLDNILMDISI
jgi:hypothetical protein